jgi:NodT family efflux transporter outer membrane factor (OMF) lipoprotein
MSRPPSRFGARRALALLVPLGALLGCTAEPPKPEEHRPEAPAAWQAELASERALEGPWWASFEDAELSALLEEALRANRDLRAAASRVEAAVVSARIAGADLLPQASAGLGGRRGRQNVFGFPFAGGEDPFNFTVTNWNLSLDLAWELDVWGRLRAFERAALADAAATEAEWSAAALSLTGLVAQAWFAVIETRQQARLAEETAQAYRETEQQLRDRAELGVAPRVDLALAEADRASAEALLEQRRSQEAAAVRQLEILLGRYPQGAIAERLDLPELPAPVPAGLPAELVHRRPDLVAAERRAQAELARGESARASLYPRLALTASGGTATEEFEDLVDGDFRVWSIGANVVQPIFEGGRLRARVELEDARAREALEGFADALLRAYAEVETALAREVPLRAQVERLEGAVASAREALTLAEQRYAEGVEGFLLVLESRRRVLVNESARIVARRAVLQNRVELYLALGGGFDARAAESAAAPLEYAEREESAEQSEGAASAAKQ